MGSKILKGTFIGGFVAWLWMLISWTLLPWHCGVLQDFSNETDVAKTIMENTAFSGIYTLPNLCNKEELEFSSELFQKGPVIFAAVRRYGFDFKSPAPFIISLIIQFIGAFLITLILMQARHLAYGSKVAMAVLIGLTIGTLGILPYWNWWGFPFPYVFVEMCDLAVAWLLAGFFIAAFTRGKHDPTKPPPKEKEEEETLWSP